MKRIFQLMCILEVHINMQTAEVQAAAVYEVPQGMMHPLLWSGALLTSGV